MKIGKKEDELAELQEKFSISGVRVVETEKENY